MAVLIKNMEMPQNCCACWALDDYGDYPRCRITEEQRGYNFPVRERRMDKCPLIEAKAEVTGCNSVEGSMTLTTPYRLDRL